MKWKRTSYKDIIAYTKKDKIFGSIARYENDNDWWAVIQIDGEYPSRSFLRRHKAKRWVECEVERRKMI